MIKIILISIALITLFQTTFAENSFIPIVKANTELVSFREGKTLNKDAWTITPEEKLDVITTNKFIGTKIVSFITDIDSITFEVTPNNTYDFVVLFNGKRAKTQINTFTNRKPTYPPKKINKFVRLDKSKNGELAKIPFTIGKDNRLYITVNVNDSEPLNFMFDSGANTNVINASSTKGKVNLKFDGQTQNSGSDGIATVKTSSNNKIVSNDLQWNDMNFLSINYKETQFDGILGWTAFENKLVEINYDEKALIIHDSTDSISSINSDYSKFEMKLLRGLPYFKGSIIINGKEKIGWFEYDTGSDWSLSLSHKFASENSLINTMKKVGTAYSSGSTGIVSENTIVLAPKIKLGEIEMYQIPIIIDKADAKGVRHNDILGNLLLKRFNAVLDFKNYQIYLKPNNNMHTPYLKSLIK